MPRCCDPATGGGGICPSISVDADNSVECHTGSLYVPDLCKSIIDEASVVPTASAMLPFTQAGGCGKALAGDVVCNALNAKATGAEAVPGSTLLLGKDCQWHALPSVSGAMTNWLAKGARNGVQQGVTKTVTQAQTFVINGTSGISAITTTPGIGNHGVDISPNTGGTYSLPGDPSLGNPVKLGADSNLYAGAKDTIQWNLTATASGHAVNNATDLPATPQFPGSASGWQAYAGTTIANNNPLASMYVYGEIELNYDIGKGDTTANRIIYAGIGLTAATGGYPAFPSTISQSEYVGHGNGAIQAQRGNIRVPIHYAMAASTTLYIYFGWSIWGSNSLAGAAWFAGVNSCTIKLYGQTYEAAI